MRNDRNKEEPTDKDCYTHYELIESLSQHQYGHGISKIEITTMTGKQYAFDCKDKTVEDFMEFFAKLDSPMNIVTEHCADPSIQYSHTVYTRQNNWMYLITMYFKDGVVI